MATGRNKPRPNGERETDLKRLLLVLLILCLAGCQPGAGAQGVNKDIAGTWQGALTVGAIKLRLVVNVNKQTDGFLKGTLVSVDQGNASAPFDTLTFQKGTLHFTVEPWKVVFDGTVSADGMSIDGAFKQPGNSMPLLLKRDANVPVVNRPQEPKKPYPYTEVEVGCENTAQHIHLAGTLTVPTGAGPFPAVLLITGSGQQDRDETLMGHKPFLVLADYLTRHGIAVLRVDDRGAGKSTGDFAAATTADFATDAEAGIAFLKTRKEVNPAQIGLIGHSEGGLIAPMIAARSKDVAFIVLMAGPGVSGAEILKLQQNLIAKALGASDATLAENGFLGAKIDAILKAEPDNTKAQQEITALVQARIDKMPEAERKAAGDPALSAKTMTSLWMRYFLFYDPQPALRKVTCPVLALNGSKDLQVPPSQNLPAIVAALTAGGNTDFTVRELPNLNHLFQTCKTGSPAEYNLIAETLAPVALETMTMWILQHTAAK